MTLFIVFIFILFQFGNGQESFLRLTVVGRTGDGKSTFCNLFLRHFHHTVVSLTTNTPHRDSSHTLNPHRDSSTTEESPALIYSPFPESEDAGSQTATPLTKTIGHIRITDTPGLVDTRGYQQDDRNIDIIVNHIKREQVNHGFLLVINEQAPRFDKAMQDSVKRLLDSFGEEMLTQLGIVFTKSWFKSHADSAHFVENQIIPMIQALQMNLSVPRLPSWQIDGHPEQLRRFEVPEEVLLKQHQRNKESILSILQWLESNPPMSTLTITAAQHAMQQELEKMRQALLEEKQLRHAFEQQVQLINATASRLVTEMQENKQDSHLLLAQKIYDIVYLTWQMLLVLCVTFCLLWTRLGGWIRGCVEWLVFAPKPTEHQESQESARVLSVAVEGVDGKGKEQGDR
eukprot:gene7999-8821_t